MTLLREISAGFQRAKWENLEYKKTALLISRAVRLKFVTPEGLEPSTN